MADNLDKQISQYKQRLDNFLSDIADGTFDEDITYIKTNYQSLSDIERKKIDEQISSWIPEKEKPFRPQPERTKRNKQNILKSITSTITGALGLPSNLREAGNRFVSNLRKEAKRNLANPGVVINNILNPPRYRTRDNIEPNNFYKNNQEVVTTDITKYKDLDNGKSHLIMFHITNSDETLVFRMANFTGLTDSFTVTNSPQRYFGRPENFYQYQSVERSITFSFDLVVQSEEDVNVMYSKLNTLSSLMYPHRYTDTKMIEPNIIRLTLGDYIVKQPFFFTSVSYTPADDVVFYENKPGQITVNVNGNLIQSEQYPQYEKRSQNRSFVSNTETNSSIGRAEIPSFTTDINTLAESRIRRVRGL